MKKNFNLSLFQVIFLASLTYISSFDARALIDDNQSLTPLHHH